MKNEEFCHLHLHSTFSKLDGFGLVEDIAERAKKLGFKYLAITDHGNIDGLIKFQKACEKHEIKSILGVEAYVVKKHDKEKRRGHITFWIKNKKGFENITKLITLSNKGEAFYYRPRMSFKDILSHYEGLCVGTACIASFLNLPGGTAFFYRLKSLIGDDLYIEIMPHNFPEQIVFNNRLLGLARRSNTKIILTNDCHYIKKNDCTTQEIMLAIQSKKKWDDPERFTLNIKGLHLRRSSEMKRAFEDIGIFKEEYLTNTIEVCKKCEDFRIEKRDIELPFVPTVKNNEDRFLEKLCFKGFKKIFEYSIRDKKEYYERFLEEINLIKKKKFTRYFLIVWELCNWCRENNILIGPGRGSVGGSLIAYLLHITSIDPLKYNLLFSRFINENRIDYPDIDIDFEHSKRHLVKEHLEMIYGEGHIAGVSSFGRIKARASIQDVSRVFDVPWQEANKFTSFIDDDTENAIDNAISNYQECKDFADKYPKVINYAKRLENQIRQSSQHAAALIISMQKLSDSGRCTLRESNGDILINWEKEDAEYMGLMKLDSLGVKVLSVISFCLDLIKKNHSKSINLENINFEDKKVLKQINDGYNIGVFQLGTWASNTLIKEMGIGKFQDIVDSVALVRPGPANSGMTKNYIERKHGSKWKKMHPVYEELTKDTFGLLVFQEQVMNVINHVAGLGYATADKIRKIIGKKRDPKEFKEYENMFLEGCKKTEIFNEREAREFWEGLQSWALYGFNKCLTGDTVIIKSSFNQYSKREISIGQLYEDWNSETAIGEKYRQQGLQIMQLHDDGRIRPGKIIGVFFQGIKKVYKITTKSGKTITGTFNHQLKTFDGYKMICRLNIGDRLAVMGTRQNSIYEKKSQTWKKHYKGKGFQKGERKKRFSNGYSIFYDKIISIEYAGKEEVFDIEMEAPFHNFVANGIVSHNSHSVGYAILAYWCSWLKTHFSTEFICASLTFGAEDKKPELIEEAYRLGLTLQLPKVGINDPFEWKAKDKTLLIPFIEVKGIGNKKAIQAATMKTESKGFYKKRTSSKKKLEKSSLAKLLDKIGAFNTSNMIDIDEDVKALFKFKIISNPTVEYKNLFDLFGKIRPDRLHNIIKGDTTEIKKLKGIACKEKSFSYFDKLIRCSKCELRQECTRPVHPSKGKYNIAIIGEAPGKEEDEEGRGFIGKSGKDLWKRLKMPRENFHITNVAKCFPKVSRKPTKEQIEICGRNYLEKELLEIKPCAILAFGNTNLQFFENRSSGIIGMSGEVKWSEKYGCWVCYCVHPSAQFHNPDNKIHYQNGIKTFRELIKALSPQMK